MAQPNVRLSTLAEIRVLSFESFRNFNQTDGSSRGDTGTNDGETDIRKNAENFKTLISGDGINLRSDTFVEKFFKTVGIARQIRIDEDYGTQNVYAIGAPTRPRIVPNNFTANVTCERIQLDRRNLYDFMSTPEYFYSPALQRATGILDAFYYTYLFVKNKEPIRGTTYASNGKYDIYALMPRTSTKTVTNGDVMISHNVQLTGFKVNHGDSSLRDFLDEVSFDDITSGLTAVIPEGITE